MINLTTADGVPTVLRFLRFLFKRTSAKAALAAVHADVGAKLAALEAAAKANDDAELDVECGTAGVEEADELLSEAFRPLSLGMETLVQGKPDDPRRRILLPKKPSEALDGVVSPEQKAFVQGVLQTLGEDAKAAQPQFAALHAFGPPIQVALTVLDAAIAARGQLDAKAAATRAAEKTAVAAAVEAHNMAEPAIKTALKTTNKKLVNSYFAKGKKAAPVAEHPA